MNLSLRENARWSLACVTSIGVRITPEDRAPVHTSRRFLMQATSAETNVLNIAASLGEPCLALTRFVEGSPVAAFIKSELRARGISFAGPDVPQEGPWGFRHQFNIADSGFGVRAPRVWNDRSGEVGRTLSPDDYDAEEIFGRQGVKILHLSGLVAALSPMATETCLAVADAAHREGTLLSFDLNYRESFWKGREEELREAFTHLASLADILIGNEEDFQLALGFHGPEAGGKDLAGKISRYRAMAEEIRAAFPKAAVIATTLREVVSANEHLWGALLLSDAGWITADPRPVPVLDRIGGGDGFAGGLLYGILKGRTAEECLELGWAGGALAVSSLNDYAEPADEKQLRDIWAGNARVQR